MSLSAVAGGPAMASEFDLLAEGRPTTSYYIDDAGALSKSTKSDLNKKLAALEVRVRGGRCCPILVQACATRSSCCLDALHQPCASHQVTKSYHLEERCA